MKLDDEGGHVASPPCAQPHLIFKPQLAFSMHTISMDSRSDEVTQFQVRIRVLLIRASQYRTTRLFGHIFHQRPFERAQSDGLDFRDKRITNRRIREYLRRSDPFWDKIYLRRCCSLICTLKLGYSRKASRFVLPLKEATTMPMSQLFRKQRTPGLSNR